MICRPERVEASLPAVQARASMAHRRGGLRELGVADPGMSADVQGTRNSCHRFALGPSVVNGLPSRLWAGGFRGGGPGGGVLGWGGFRDRLRYRLRGRGRERPRLRLTLAAVGWARNHPATVSGRVSGRISKIAPYSCSTRMVASVWPWRRAHTSIPITWGGVSREAAPLESSD
jgi:hypothetical protein